VVLVPVTGVKSTAEAGPFLLPPLAVPLDINCRIFRFGKSYFSLFEHPLVNISSAGFIRAGLSSPVSLVFHPSQESFFLSLYSGVLSIPALSLQVAFSRGEEFNSSYTPATSPD